jgi:two-component system cell cycle response regulator
LSKEPIERAKALAGPPRFRILRRALWAFALAVSAVYALDVAVGVLPDSIGDLGTGVVYVLPYVAGGAICLLRVVEIPRERLIWSIFGISMLLTAGGWIYYLAVLVDMEAPPYPSPADAFWLAFYAGALVALLLLMRSQLETFAGTVWLDALTALLALSAISAALLLHPLLAATDGKADAIVTTLAYPIFDVLLLGVVLGMFVLSGWRPTRRWIVLGLAWCAQVVGDVIYLYLVANGTWQPGTWQPGTVLDLAWLGAQLAVAYAAWQPPARQPHTLQFRGPATIAVPLAFSAVAIALLAVGNLDDEVAAYDLPAAAVLLALAALIASLAGTAKAYLDQRRLEGLARRDPLTGLLNYREFHRRLDLALVGTERTGTTLAVVAMDLNGFKDVNDQRGHTEGDRVLRRVAEALTDAKRGADSAFRTGGDEFMLLLPDSGFEGGTAAGARVSDAVAALDEGVTMAFGVAEWPTDGPGKEMLLLRADVSMYTHKSSGTEAAAPALIPTGGGLRAGDSDRSSVRSRRTATPADPELEQERAQLRAYAQAVRESYIEGLQRAEQLKQNYLATVLTLASAVEAKDDYTGGHIHRVHDLGLLLARAVVPREADDPHLAYGFLLHDIGKLAVPDAVLNKPGKLDDREWELMRGHPEAGVRILCQIPFLGRALDVVRHHHERWDGCGYPDGLAGEDIPNWARIFAVVDTVDAITSDRPYRSGMPLRVALEEVQKGAGAQFDPACVDAFLGLDPERVEELIEARPSARPLRLRSEGAAAGVLASGSSPATDGRLS